MKKILTVGLLFICSCTFAQYSPKDVMAKLKVQSVPFDGTGEDGRIRGSAVDVEDGELSRKIYSNAQLTEWWDMKESADAVYYCWFQIDNPSHKNKYFFISLNAMGDYWTYIMASVAPNGKIDDWIDASVIGSAYLETDAQRPFRNPVIMQYRVLANGDVLISRIMPTSSESISLGRINDFHGCRQDTTYRLDQDGKFQVVGVMKYTPQLYTVQMLSDPDYHVWNGSETPVSE